VDMQDRSAGRADDLIGDGEQTLIAAAAEEEAKHRNLAEHVVQPVDRHEGAAHAHLVGRVVQRPLDGAADRRSLRHAFAHGELAVLTTELGAQAGEEDAVLRPARATGSDPVERRLALYREVAHIEQAFLGARLDRWRVHGECELAADHLGIHIVEAEEGAGVVGLEIDHVAPEPLLAALLELRAQRRVLADLAVEREALDDAAAAGKFQVDAAERLAIVAGNRAELEIDIEVDVLQLALAVL